MRWKISIWLEPRAGTSLADSGGFELEEHGSGRWAQSGGEKHMSIAPDERQCGHTPNRMLVISKLQFGWRIRCHNDGRTEDVKDTSKYNELGLQAVYEYRSGPKRSRIQRTRRLDLSRVTLVSIVSIRCTPEMSGNGGGPK